MTNLHLNTKSQNTTPNIDQLWACKTAAKLSGKVFPPTLCPAPKALLPLLRGLQTQEQSVGWISARSHSKRSLAQFILPFPWALLPSKAVGGAGTRDPSSALHLSCSLQGSPATLHFWSSAQWAAEGSGEILWLLQWMVHRLLTSLDLVSPMQLSVADTNISCSRPCPQVLVVIFSPCTGLHWAAYSC